MSKITLNTVPSKRLATRLAEQADILLCGDPLPGYESTTALAWWYPGLNLLNWISLIKVSGEIDLARALEDCALLKDPRG